MTYPRLSILLAICVFGLLWGCKADTPEDVRLFHPLVDVWPHALSDIPPDPDVTYGVLENGMRYALRANSRPKGEASLRFWVRAGSRNETDETLGLAHYLEHMAFNGSKNVPEGEMVKSLEKLGLSFGADTNASTTLTRTEYTLNLPDTGDETVDYALFLMRETADKLLIEPDAVERERGVVKAEEARGNTPLREANHIYRAFLYPDLLSTKRPVIGTPETLDSISAEQLRAFYEAHYRPERTFLVMTGDFDVAVMEQKIRDMFDDWTVSTPAPPDPDNGSVTARPASAYVHSHEELTTFITMIDVKPPTQKPDMLDNRLDGSKRGYANAIVNQRIRKKLLESGAAVRSANIGYSTSYLGDQLSARAGAKNDDWKAAIEILDMEIRTALEHGFQQAELDELLANSRRSLTDSVNYAAKRTSGGLASNIISSFANGRVLTTPQQSFDIFEDFEDQITIDDLEETFREMWSDFDPSIWLNGPGLDAVTEADVLATMTKARQRPAAKPSERQVLEFAYQDFGTPGKIASRSRVEDLDIDQIVFENNVKLNLKTTDFEDKWVRLSVTVGEGWNIFPKDQPEILPLARSFALGGYEAHKVSELSEIFAGKNVGVNMAIGETRLSFSGSTNPDDVEDQLKAWTALMTAPGYRPEWREKFIEGIEASFHTIDSTPGAVASRDLGRLWSNGDRRFGLLEKEAYQSAKIEDVRGILEPIFQNGAIEIGVVGDFDKQAVIDAVAKTYGALPMRKTEHTPNPAAFDFTFPAPDRVKLTHTGAANQGAIFMGWPMQQAWTIDRSRAYGMVRQIFQNRMTDIIREDMGLTYSPGASLDFGKNKAPYGYISASMTSDPQYFEPFEQAAKDIAADLRDGGITQEDLDRAMKPVLESFERSERENGSWLGLVTISQTQPEQLDWRRNRVEAYTAMTPAMLDAAAKELFDPKGLHIVEIGPESAE